MNSSTYYYIGWKESFDIFAELNENIDTTLIFSFKYEATARRQLA